MEINQKIKQSENLHILLWLIKDICWLHQWVLAGTIMFFPTLILAIYICVKTRLQPLSLIVNLAVLSWICANASWMLGEFYKWDLKILSTLFFILGILLMGVYVFKIVVQKQE